MLVPHHDDGAAEESLDTGVAQEQLHHLALDLSAYQMSGQDKLGRPKIRLYDHLTNTTFAHEPILGGLPYHELD